MEVYLWYFSRQSRQERLYSTYYFLLLVQKYKDVNMMTATNLAVVVGPSICKREDGDMMTEMQDMPDLNAYVNI